MATRAILDANLLLVFSIGKRHRELLGCHRRVKEYMPEACDLLVQLVDGFEQIVLTPNAVTECSGLLKDSAAEGDTRRLSKS